MEIESKNRFDEKKPFDVIRAEDFGGDLYEFYEPLSKLLRKVSGVDITGSRPVFLIGGRGTGKTMVLKFLSLEMQLKDFIKNTLHQDKSIQGLTKDDLKFFLKQQSAIGIFLHFRTSEYGSIKGDLDLLFKPYLSIRIAEEILRCLMICKTSGLLDSYQERKITRYLIDQVREPKANGANTLEEALGFIRGEVLRRFETIIEKSSYCSIEEIKTSYEIPVIVSKNVIFGIPDMIFQELDFLRGKQLFILLDELEFLNDYQKRCIGQLIKDSDETSVIFKIGSRYLPRTLHVGESGEVLQEPDDFRKINITDALNAAHSGKKQSYWSLIKSILNRRLAKSSYFAKAGIKRIEDLFPDLPIEDEALALVRGRDKHWKQFRTFLKATKKTKEIDAIVESLRCPHNPIAEKLNMLLYYRKKSLSEIRRMCKNYLRGQNRQYKLLYQKNALNLLFQLHSDYRSEKKYVGIDVFVHLSSGIIRKAIELCSQALNTAYNYGYEPSKKKPVDFVHQDLGAKNHAGLQFEDITRIPGNLGTDVRDFIKEIGTVFRALHLNRYLVEPEPTHFETICSEIAGPAKEVFNAALNHSYLQRKPAMDPKSHLEVKKDDFLLNRVFAPFFEISYRVRGRTYVSGSQIADLVTGDDKKKRQTRRAIITANAKKEKVHVDLQERLFGSDEEGTNETY